MKAIQRGTDPSTWPVQPDLWTMNPDTGILAVAYSVEFRVLNLTGDAPVELHDWADADADAGLVGRYVAAFSVAEDADAGLYRVEWRWTMEEDGTLYQVARDVDVVAALWEDPGPWLCLPSDLRAEGFTAAILPEQRLQRILTNVGAFIRENTGRLHFEPTQLEMEVTGAGTDVLLLPDVVVAVSAVESGYVSSGERVPFTVELDDLEVLNRHLRIGMVGNHDDRDLPGLRMIEGAWTAGATYWVRGAFGYTDPEQQRGGRQMPGPGDVPLPLRQVAGRLCVRESPQALIMDEVEDRRRRHLVQSDRVGSHGMAFFPGAKGGITGDAEIDRVLARYIRPFGGGVV